MHVSHNITFVFAHMATMCVRSVCVCACDAPDAHFAHSFTRQQHSTASSFFLHYGIRHRAVFVTYINHQSIHSFTHSLTHQLHSPRRAACSTHFAMTCATAPCSGHPTQTSIVNRYAQESFGKQ
jgi:hypothetical protein